MLGGLGFGLGFGLLGGLANGLGFGLLVGLLGGLAGGLRSEMLDTHKLITPNQGIWSSARNGLLIGLLVGLLVGLCVGLDFGLFVGLYFGLYFGLVSGGDAFIMHFVLRWFLWRAGFIPWNYPRFLDYAADRILLRKVGGGYVFVHRLLLEYFAELSASSTSNEVAKHV